MNGQSCEMDQQERDREKELARAAYARGVECTPGCPRGDVGGRLYSVEEMKGMNSKEVKRCYNSLMASLKRGFEKLY